MQIKSTYYLFILLMFLSCKVQKTGWYETVANDVAKIQLVLLKNKKFELHFKDLEEKPEKITYLKGSGLNTRKKYAFISNWIKIIFLTFMHFLIPV